VVVGVVLRPEVLTVVEFAGQSSDDVEADGAAVGATPGDEGAVAGAEPDAGDRADGFEGVAEDVAAGVRVDVADGSEALAVAGSSLGHVWVSFLVGGLG
jgi:hypothetical protein